MHAYCRVSKTVSLIRIFNHQSVVLAIYQKIWERYRKIFVGFNAAGLTPARAREFVRQHVPSQTCLIPGNTKTSPCHEYGPSRFQWDDFHSHGLRAQIFNTSLTPHFFVQFLHTCQSGQAHKSLGLTVSWWVTISPRFFLHIWPSIKRSRWMPPCHDAK